VVHGHNEKMFSVLLLMHTRYDVTLLVCLVLRAKSVGATSGEGLPLDLVEQWPTYSRQSTLHRFVILAALCIGNR